MMDDREQKIKQELLLDLISKMSDQSGERLVPHKGLAVEVAAPDKSKLAEGLDKAKDVLGGAPEDDESHLSGSEEDDEHRMMQLLADEDEEDGHPGRR